MKILNSFLLISSFSYGVEIHHGRENVVVRPFGLQSRQPPAPSRTVRLPTATFSISANQVCGYTDWTSLQLDLPKKLLSKQYWKKIGNNLVLQAKQTVMDMTYALPGVLTCNVVPSYCHVFNQAEMMSAFEGDLSMKTCEILDGVANTKGLMHETLLQCQKAMFEGDSKMTASEARERCLRGETPKGQIEKMGKKASRVEPSFSMDEFLDDLFPGEIDQNDFTKDGFVYSRRTRTKNLFKELFPGVEVRGSAVVRNGGTFQPVIENYLGKESKKIRDSVTTILKEMKKYHKQGYHGKDVIGKTKSLWADKSKWKKDKQPHPIYRSPYDDSEPTFLIQPEQIYGLLPLAEDGIDDNQALYQVVDRMSQGVSFLKLQDHLFDIQTRATAECYGEKNQSASAQQNCQNILKRTKMSMEFLEHKMVAEERVIRIQREINSLIDGVRLAKANQFLSSPSERADLYEKRKIPLPNGH